jgi:hypothetical protein
MIRRFILWWRWVFRARKFAEPDQARLNFLGSGYEICNGGLDLLHDNELLERLNAMKCDGARWVVVVQLTRDRKEQFWVHQFMVTFGPPVSAITLQDGRRAFMTWAAC